MTRDEGIKLLETYVSNQNLRRHMYACEAAMISYAKKFNGDPGAWGLVGLLHDFDWEIHPTLAEHPTAGQPLLEQAGVPADIRRAILAHAPHTGVTPTNDMERAIIAVDELTGFIVACTLVTPNKKLADVTIETIKKKLKQKAFAANVNRSDIDRGPALLGVTPDEHFQTVLTAMQGIHETLGL